MADDDARRRSRDLGALLADDSIRLDEHASSRDDAVRLVGRVLVDSGAAEPSYIDAMIEREQSVSTFVGDGVAFPHATFAAEDAVLRDAIVLVRFDEEVDWNGDPVRIAVGIAALGRGHIGILSRLARVLLRPAAATALRAATSPAGIRSVISPDRSAR